MQCGAGRGGGVIEKFGTPSTHYCWRRSRNISPNTCFLQVIELSPSVVRMKTNLDHGSDQNKRERERRGSICCWLLGYRLDQESWGP